MTGKRTMTQPDDHLIGETTDERSREMSKRAERIASIQRSHRIMRVMVARRIDYRCLCGWQSRSGDCTWTDHPEHVANAVIRELGLREEWLVDDVEPYDTREQAEERKAELIGDYGDDPPAEGVPVRRRYVTDWTADEGNRP